MKLSLVQNVPQKYSLMPTTRGTNQQRPNLNMETTYWFLHQENLVWEGRRLLFEIKSVPTKKVHLHSGMGSLSHLRPTNISQIRKPDLWDTF